MIDFQDRHSQPAFTCNEALYARYSELLRLEEEADIAFDRYDVEYADMRRAGVAISDDFLDGYAQARDVRDALFDERTELRGALLNLPRPTGEQILVNLQIVSEEADIFDGAGEHVRLVAAQVRALIA